MIARVRRAGFTLIELLVVIAIIALLASILMPTLQKAMEMARMSQCSGQFRHVGSAYAMYAEENNDYIISTCIPDGGTFQPNVYYGTAEVTRNMLMQYMSVKGKPVNPAAPFAADNRSHPVFCCPTASKQLNTTVPQWWSTGPSIVFGAGPSSNDNAANPPQYYYYNGSKARLFPRQYTDLRWAAETAGLADTTVYGFYSWDPLANGTWGPVTYRHIGERILILCGDHHMAAMTKTQGLSSKPPYQIGKYK